MRPRQATIILFKKPQFFKFSRCVKCEKLNNLVFLFLCHFNGNLTAFQATVWNLYCFFTYCTGVLSYFTYEFYVRILLLVSRTYASLVLYGESIFKAWFKAKIVSFSTGKRLKIFLLNERFQPSTKFQ